MAIGLHPDEATRPEVERALIRPVIIVSCCNYWDKTKKLGFAGWPMRSLLFMIPIMLGLKRLRWALTTQMFTLFQNRPEKANKILHAINDGDKTCRNELTYGLLKI